MSDNRRATMALYRSFIKLAHQMNSSRPMVLQSTPPLSSLQRYRYYDPVVLRTSILNGICHDNSYDADVSQSPFIEPSTVKDIVRNAFRKQDASRDMSQALTAGYSAFRAVSAMQTQSINTSVTESTFQDISVRIICSAIYVGPIRAVNSNLMHHYAYRIQIENISKEDTKFQVLGRHWVFTNASGTVEMQVPKFSEGVIGETPVIELSKGFEYMSQTTVTTEVGGMYGSLLLLDTATNTQFEARIERSMEFTDSSATIRVMAKWRGSVICLQDIDMSSTSVRDLKVMLEEQTSVSIHRMRVLGLDTKATDDKLLSQYSNKVKRGQLHVSVMGTPDNEIQEFESIGEGVQESVLNDFGHNFTPATDEWHKLKYFTDSLEINFINEPRAGKKLLVLDLDHTILDFSSKGSMDPIKMKRPYMDFFLEKAYEHFDIAVWSQTHWRWVEIKLIELDIINNPRYKLCFVLDKASMFRCGPKKRYIKPLHIIWSKFPCLWGRHNTVHVDDLERNFAMNPESGILVTAFYRPDRERKKGEAREKTSDMELLPLSSYLSEVGAMDDLSAVCHKNWKERADVLIRGTDSSFRETDSKPSSMS